MTTENPLLARVRKLLAKAEAAGTTPAEAEALSAGQRDPVTPGLVPAPARGPVSPR